MGDPPMLHSIRAAHILGTRRLLGPLLVAALLCGCGVAVRSDRAAIGGGPAQATAQAQAVYRSTVVALATVNAGTAAGSTIEPCDCEAGK